MKLKIKEITLFALLGSLMFALKYVMQSLPNIHLLGVFIVAITVVFRAKALWPIYVYVFIDGLIGGFATWWLPYLYIWTVLWAVIMILPKNMSTPASTVVYTIVCTLHGLLFGVLYAPAQALFYGLDFNGMLTWIATGFWFDFLHGISDFLATLILSAPLIKLLQNAKKHIS